MKRNNTRPAGARNNVASNDFKLNNDIFPDTPPFKADLRKKLNLSTQ